MVSFIPLALLKSACQGFVPRLFTRTSAKKKFHGPPQIDLPKCAYWLESNFLLASHFVFHQRVFSYQTLTNGSGSNKGKNGSDLDSWRTTKEIFWSDIFQITQ